MIAVIVVFLIILLLVIAWSHRHPPCLYHPLDTGPMEDAARIEYYCQDVFSHRVTCIMTDDGDSSFIRPGTDLTVYAEYGKDMKEYLSQLGNRRNGVFKWHPRDRVEWFETPTLVKTRSLDSSAVRFKGSVLCKFNRARHFGPMKGVASMDIPFHKKKNTLVWRGATTGYGFGNNIPHRAVSRQTLIEKFCNENARRQNIDVGLVIRGGKKTGFEAYTRPMLSMKEMLQYKYILSVEGHDVATNLKWAMLSNSVILMPAPCIESWIMEGFLIAGVHYVRVADDFSDLLEKKTWCDEHPSECLEIIRNAKRYISRFMNETREMAIQKAVLIRYLDHVRFVKKA
jgi:hypothetical protein